MEDKKINIENSKEECSECKTKNALREQAKNVLFALGGKENIVYIESCSTRLLLKVENPNFVNEKLLKENGAHGVLINETSLKVVFGPQVVGIKSELDKIM